MNVINMLNERGFIEQMTHPEEIEKLLEKKGVPFYIGIDPTADSLHVGHFVSLMVASHLQKARQQTNYSNWWWYSNNRRSFF